jgi:hypothetical protein
VFEFDASFRRCEVPVGLDVIDISLLLPGGDFVDEGLFVGMRRARHWDDRTLSSARSSQLPCFGV